MTLVGLDSGRTTDQPNPKSEAGLHTFLTPQPWGISRMPAGSKLLSCGFSSLDVFMAGTGKKSLSFARFCFGGRPTGTPFASGDLHACLSRRRLYGTEWWHDVGEVWVGLAVAKRKNKTLAF